MNPAIQHQAELIARNWGRSAALRYLSMYQSSPPQKPIRTERWISNTVHQPKRFSETQAAIIRREVKVEGLTYQEVADRHGCCRGTVGNVVKRLGAYKKGTSEL